MVIYLAGHAAVCNTIIYVQQLMKYREVNMQTFFCTPALGCTGDAPLLVFTKMPVKSPTTTCAPSAKHPKFGESSDYVNIRFNNTVNPK